ncbi:MAG: RNA-directed DNA polymerase [Paludibacteraceae bacterium]
MQNNGNYWSATPNDSNNANYLNFNSNEADWNNNNRYNGQAVRLVQDLSTTAMCDPLLSDLFQAYYDARKHKRKTRSQLQFEMDMEHQIVALYDELRYRTYRPSTSVCFIINDPKKREVFASSFRDRVVHHLYYNYIASLCDRRFIYDSYSCREGKGTLLGIERLEHRIRAVSHNYTRKAYVLKLDLQGYFMSIPREQLRREVHALLARVLPKSGLRRDIQSLVLWLTDVFTLHEPLVDCRVRGSRTEWEGLPASKSLWHSPAGVGLPIGDLTSQLYSNIFLNRLDRFVTEELGCRHYGRYVDDFYLLSASRGQLRSWLARLQPFVATLGMRLHPRKIILQPVSLPCRQKETPPLEFLGAVVFPYYRHCTHRTLAKYRLACRTWGMLLVRTIHAAQYQACFQAYMSYAGYLSHFRAREVR